MGSNKEQVCYRLVLSTRYTLCAESRGLTPRLCHCRVTSESSCLPHPRWWEVRRTLRKNFQFFLNSTLLSPEGRSEARGPSQSRTLVWVEKEGVLIEDALL